MNTFTPLVAAFVATATLTGCQPNNAAPEVTKNSSSTVSTASSVSVNANKERFTSPNGAVSFEYTAGANGYTLDARQDADGYGVLLIRTADAEAMKNRPDSEEPISMNIIVYPNTNNEPAKAWALTSGQTGLNEDTETTPRTVDGQTGIQFNWEGLYNGQTVVIATEQYVYTFTHTTNAETFVQRTAFNNLLRSVTLQ